MAVAAASGSRNQLAIHQRENLAGLSSNRTMHAQIGCERALQCSIVRPCAVVTAAGPATNLQQTFVFEHPRGLLDGDDAYPQQSADLIERTDVGARIARQNQLTQLGNRLAHQIASRRQILHRRSFHIISAYELPMSITMHIIRPHWQLAGSCAGVYQYYKPVISRPFAVPSPSIN